MLCIATWKTWAKFDRGEKAERRQSGRVKFLNAMFEATCVKVGRDAEHTGNNTELESSRHRVLQWRWVKASSMKQALEIDADKRQADRSRDFIESIIIELHRVAVGAKRR
jgi:hypothetical protein